MEKYGVEENPPDKVAQSSTHCPNCGTELENLDHTGVAKCPTCGTKPFEFPDDEKK